MHNASCTVRWSTKGSWFSRHLQYRFAAARGLIVTTGEQTELGVASGPAPSSPSSGHGRYWQTVQSQTCQKVASSAYPERCATLYNEGFFFVPHPTYLFPGSCPVDEQLESASAAVQHQMMASELSRLPNAIIILFALSIVK